MLFFSSLHLYQTIFISYTQLTVHEPKKNDKEWPTIIFYIFSDVNISW